MPATTEKAKKGSSTTTSTSVAGGGGASVVEDPGSGHTGGAQGFGLEEIGIPGRDFLRDALTNCSDPLKAIEEFQVYFVSFNP